MAWLHTIALDFYEWDQSNVEQEQITWEHWCNVRAASMYVAQMVTWEERQELDAIPEAERRYLSVRPVISYEQAYRGREVFRVAAAARPDSQEMADDAHEQLHGLRNGANPLASGGGEEEGAEAELERREPDLSRPVYDTGDGDRDAAVSYGLEAGMMATTVRRMARRNLVHPYVEQQDILGTSGKQFSAFGVHDAYMVVAVGFRMEKSRGRLPG